MDEYDFTLKNHAAEIEPLQNSIATTLQADGVRLHYIYTLNLALGEWLENVIQYAFSDDATHDIQVQCLVSELELRVRITDEGRAFDPGFKGAAHPAPPDTSAFASRGLHLIRSLLDEVTYERRDGRNVVVMTKRING